MVISGKELAAACKAKMAEQVKTFPEKYGRLPHLVVVLVGEDAGSVSYVTGKTKAADEVGILNTTIRKPADISEEELLKIIDDLNADDTVDGILIQLPLPKHIDSDKVIARIRQEKDVDGFHPLNVAALWQKQPCVLPCTPKGIMKLLKDSGVELAGRSYKKVGMWWTEYYGEMPTGGWLSIRISGVDIDPGTEGDAVLSSVTFG